MKSTAFKTSYAAICPSRKVGVSTFMKSIELIPVNLSQTVFCDGSAHASDHHSVCRIKFAAWSAHDCSFEIQALVPDTQMAKHDLIMLSEMSAIDLALQFNPSIIYTDSQYALKNQAKKLSKTVELRWCRRSCNHIADLLSKSPAGKGYVIFNHPLPQRGWINFIYQEKYE